jgi:hypothetical protein
MPIVLKKKPQVEATAAPVRKAPAKAKSPLKAVPAIGLVSEHADLIDNYGRLAKELAPEMVKLKKMQEKLKPLADAEKALKAAMADLAVGDDKTGTELGETFLVEYGKRGTSREIIDVKAIHEMLGDELFYAMASLKLGDVDAYLTPPQKELVIKESRSARSIKVKAREAA